MRRVIRHKTTKLRYPRTSPTLKRTQKRLAKIRLINLWQTRQKKFQLLENSLLRQKRKKKRRLLKQMPHQIQLPKKPKIKLRRCPNLTKKLRSNLKKGPKKRQARKSPREEVHANLKPQKTRMATKNWVMPKSQTGEISPSREGVLRKTKVRIKPVTKRSTMR